MLFDNFQIIRKLSSHISCLIVFVSYILNVDIASAAPDKKITSGSDTKLIIVELDSLKKDCLYEILDDLPHISEVIRGESRNPGATGKWTHLMGDVLSSRTKIKRRNATCETILQRYAEPFSLLGSLVGGEYMKSALELAWKYLLQNHPHDNICGAGIDQMEKDMMYRFDQCEILSKGIMRRGLSAIVKNINNNDSLTFIL